MSSWGSINNYKGEKNPWHNYDDGTKKIDRSIELTLTKVILFIRSAQYLSKMYLNNCSIY